MYGKRYIYPFPDGEQESYIDTSVFSQSISPETCMYSSLAMKSKRDDRHPPLLGLSRGPKKERWEVDTA
jgi:hypothetical protein